MAARPRAGPVSDETIYPVTQALVQRLGDDERLGDVGSQLRETCVPVQEYNTGLLLLFTPWHTGAARIIDFHGHVNHSHSHL